MKLLTTERFLLIYVILAGFGFYLILFGLAYILAGVIPWPM